MNDEQLHELMKEAESCLIDGSIKQAADAFMDIAKVYAGAGLFQEFAGIRQHIIMCAEQRTCEVFIKEKLEQIEKEMRNDRTITNAFTGRGSLVN